MTNAAKRRGSGSSWAELWAIYRLETNCVLYQGVSKYRIPGDRKSSKGFRILAGAQARWYLSNPDPNSDFSDPRIVSILLRLPTNVFETRLAHGLWPWALCGCLMYQPSVSLRLVVSPPHRQPLSCPSCDRPSSVCSPW